MGGLSVACRGVRSAVGVAIPITGPRARVRLHATTLALQASDLLEGWNVLPSVSRFLDELALPAPGDRITPMEMDEIRSRHPGFEDISVFVETGTLEAANVVNLAPAFREAHSIELSRPLYRAAVKRFGPRTRFGINFHCGDSAEVLPALLKTIQQPAVMYLDGHYCLYPFTAASQFPLWAELGAIAKRPYREVVIVDDVHTFDTKRPELEAQESGSSWAHVTADSILGALGRDRIIDHFIHRDQFVICLAGASTASQFGACRLTTVGRGCAHSVM